MKKIMWIVAMIPVVVTSVVLQFMPDVIPMHHDLEGNTDRWGSKTESLIFPVIILFITLFWHLLINVFEKKSITAKTEKEQMEAKSSAKVLCVVGLSQAIMFGIMGKKLGVEKVHPHKFRRTMATRAIEKGMPIEQVQKILGHEQIDTTLRYAMVNQNNVKLSHRKYIS